MFFEAPGSSLEPSVDGYEVVVLPSGRRIRVQAAHEVLLLRMKEFVGTGHTSAFQQSLWLLGRRHSIEIRSSAERTRNLCVLHSPSWIATPIRFDGKARSHRHGSSKSWLGV